MNQPQIKIEFGNYADTQKQIREIYIQSVHQAITAARGNRQELQEWVNFAKEVRWVADELLGECLYGKAVTAEEKQILS